MQEEPCQDDSLVYVGNLAHWVVSTAKPHHGVENILDLNVDSHWQSEGPQPHLINAVFSKKTPLSQISIYANINLDDSYTPRKIAIRAGTTYNSLLEVKYVELTKPEGWVHIKLSATEPIYANIFQIAILGNHQNGKDTHVRGVRLYGPRRKEPIQASTIPYTSVEFTKHATIR